MRNYLESRRRQTVDKVAQCNAWLAFMRHPGWERLFELGVDINENWYNEWADFDCRFPGLNDQKVLRSAINAMMQKPFVVSGDPTLFKRRDIYDKMAYASFPLGWFVETQAKATVTFSLPLPMVFAVSSFKLKRTHKAHQGDKWWGRLYLHDGRVPQAFTPREVAERVDFPNETTREQMFEELLNEVREKEESSLFTITGDSMIGAMIQAESEQLLALKRE